MKRWLVLLLLVLVPLRTVLAFAMPCSIGMPPTGPAAAHAECAMHAEAMSGSQAEASKVVATSHAHHGDAVQHAGCGLCFATSCGAAAALSPASVDSLDASALSHVVRAIDPRLHPSVPSSRLERPPRTA